MMDVLNVIDALYQEKHAPVDLEVHGEDRLAEWHRDIEIKDSDICGQGLFATKDIRAGTLLWRFNKDRHRIIPFGQFWSFDQKTRSELYRYCWKINHYEMLGPNIDDNGNFDHDSLDGIFVINHSSDPNAWFEGDENLIAKRDIFAGEEIVLDYATREASGLAQPFESRGEHERRRFFHPFDFEEMWEEYQGHTHSYVQKMAKHLGNIKLGEGPFHSLNSKVISKMHPLGFGRGLFAREDIKKGEIVWIEKNDSGDLQYLSYDEFNLLDQKRKEFVYHYGYQVDYDTIAIPREVEMIEEDHSYLMNHRCDPNCVFYGHHILIARRDIPAGEELTFDYATSETVFHHLVCFCGSEDCRKNVREDDWQIPELREKYENLWQPFILGLFWRKSRDK